MYEVKGRQYLVVSATANVNNAGSRSAATGPAPVRSYIAFALPERPAR
jgi:hypothetical protein